MLRERAAGVSSVDVPASSASSRASRHPITLADAVAGAMTMSTCCGCGAVLPRIDGRIHPYVVSSPACWAAYGEVSARTYQDPQRQGVLQVQVDTYAAQHPGQPGRRSAQSVGIHLMTLCLVLERGADPREGPRLHKQMVQRPVFRWLEPPRIRGLVTVLDVLATGDADSHIAAVNDWGRSVWEAWAPHHATVRAWLDLGR